MSKRKLPVEVLAFSIIIFICVIFFLYYLIAIIFESRFSLFVAHEMTNISIRFRQIQVNSDKVAVFAHVIVKNP